MAKREHLREFNSTKMAGGFGRNGTHSPDITYVINVVDRQYAENRQRAIENERRQQRERDQVNDSFAPHWEKIVATYGGEEDATN